MRRRWIAGCVLLVVGVAGAAWPLLRPSPLTPAARIERGIVGTVWRGADPAPGVRVEVWRSRRIAAGEGSAAEFVDFQGLGVRWMEQVIATTRSDTSGQFSVDGLGLGSYVVRASASDGASGGEGASIEADGAIVQADVDIRAGSLRLRGRLADAARAASQPIVIVTSQYELHAPMVDDDGRFSIDGMVDDRFMHVCARVPGSWSVTWHGGPSAGGAETTYTLPAPEHEVVGRVVSESDSGLVARAQVVVSASRDKAHEWVAATADADGRFRVRCRLGTPGITAWADGFAPVTVAAGAGGDVSVSLAQLARIEGRVTDRANGAPVAGAVVEARPTRDPRSSLGRRSGPTSEDGRFQIEGLVPGDRIVCVHGADWVSPGLTDIHDGGFNPFLLALRAGETATRDCVAVRTATLRGSVRLASGDPARGATVRAWPVDPIGGGLMVDEAVAADSRGEFTFRGEPGISVVLSTAAAGSGTARAGPWMIGGGESVHDPIVLPAGPAHESKADPPARSASAQLTKYVPAATPPPPVPNSLINIRVVDADDGPVAHALVALKSKGRTTWAAVQRGKAEIPRESIHESAILEIFRAQGAKDRALPVGPWRGAVSADGADLSVRLPPERHAAGFVRDESGRGIAGALVRAFPQGSGWDSQSDRSTPPMNERDCIGITGGWREGSLGLAHGMGRTDSAGSFRLGGLGDFAYELWVEGPPDAIRGEHVLVLAGATDVAVTLRLGTSPRVTVLDEANHPLTGATVIALDRSGAPLRPLPPGQTWNMDPIAKSGPDGVAWLRGLDPSRACTLRVAPPHPQPTDAPLLEAWTDGWSPADSIVTLDAGRAVRGVVRDAAQSAVARTRVSWKDARMGWREIPVDDSGAFVTPRVRRASPVPLRAYLPDFGSGSPRWLRQAEAVVPPGADSVVVDLVEAARLRLLVEGANPRDIIFANLRVEPAEDTNARTNQTHTKVGVLTFDRGLWASDSFAVRVSQQGLVAWRRGLRAGPDEVRLQLGPGRSVVGTITAPEGAHVERAWGTCWGFGFSGKLLADGKFEVSGLPDGPCEVGAYARGGEGVGYEASSSALAGGTVDLVLTRR